jgi:hypothetical protein
MFYVSISVQNQPLFIDVLVEPIPVSVNRFAGFVIKVRTGSLDRWNYLNAHRASAQGASLL